MKPFGITIHKEIDNLQMDLIHQVLRDYKLKGRRKSEYKNYRKYGGYQILVQKVFEGDLSCDGICMKLKF